MLNKKIVLSVTVAIAVVLALAFASGCGRSAPTTPVPTITLTDDAGRTVEIPTEPQRIISLAPSNTELLFVLGLGDRVVGVSDFTTYPPEAAEIESVGGMPVNHEKIVSLDPDLILAAGLTTQEDLARLEELGQPVMILDPKDIEGILANFALLGQATGTEAKAQEVASSLRQDWEAVLVRTKEISERPRVFVELDETLFTVAPGSFIHPLIEMAGGDNIAADVTNNPYPQLSSEQIIERDPQVIVLTDAAYGATPEKVKARPGWDVVTAVKDDAVHAIDPDIISRPGPRVIQGLEALAKLIHPELWE